MRADEIKDRGSLEKWMSERPEATRQQEAIVLAHRAAMRVVPLMQLRGNLTPNQHEGLLKVGFWLNAIARASLYNRTQALRDAFSATSFAMDYASIIQHFALDGDAAIYSSPGSEATERAIASAATYSIEAAFSADAASVSAGFAAASINPVSFSSSALATYASAAAVGYAGRNPSHIWKELQLDVRHLEKGLDLGDLANSKVWAAEPAWWSDELARLNELIKSPQLKHFGYDVWYSWYLEIAQGKPIFNIRNTGLREILERNMALGSTDGTFNKTFWSRDPAAINADIKRWVDEAQAADKVSILPPLQVPPEAAVQPPNPNVTQFTQNAEGRIIAVADPLEPAAGRDRADLEELYEEARNKALEAQILGRNMLGPCHDPLEQLMTVVPEDFASVRVNRLHAKLSSLRDRVYLHDLQLAKRPEDRDHSLVLQEEVAVRLAACVKQFNLVLAFDKRGRELNSLQHGPEARQRAEELNNALRPVVINVGDVGDAAVVNVIVGDNNAVRNASRDIHGDQAVVRVAEQNENLAMAVLQSGWRIAREMERQGLTQPTLELIISVAGQHGPRIVEFVQKFDQAFLWLAQHVEAFQILMPLIVYLVAIRLRDKKGS